MNKIPVWRTIGSAYGFAFDNLATIIGLIWLPLTLLFVGEYFAFSRYFEGVSSAIANGNRFAVYGGMTYLYLYRFAALFLQAIIAVPVMRQALGLRRTGAFVHFGLGLAELRLFGAFVAYFLILLTIEIVGFILFLALVIALNFAVGTLGVVQGVPVPLVALCMKLALLLGLLSALLYLSVRLSFFLAAVTIAENRIDLIHSWTLTQGNFWRILWVAAAVTVPTWILYLAIQIAFVGFASYNQAIDLVPNAGQFAGNLRTAAAQMHLVLRWLPYVYGAWFLVQPLALGLMSGAAAAAYRALVPEVPAVSTPPADSPLPVATS